MSFHKGNGGKITVASADVHVSKWEMTKESELANTTHSGTAGWETKFGTIKRGTLVMEIPWDDTQMPDVDLGLEEGDAFTGSAFVGDSTKVYAFSGCVGSVKLVSDSTGDIVRSTVTASIWNIVNPST